ncbi:uncharacterized protein LOC134801053 isoform X2 [Cydia splendana]|uniref:uncharacterized protein LOC134801053 isoform X2 n=1 Tax=Cydia splendana TaxID=1100963 RepID=UPI00300D06F8
MALWLLLIIGSQTWCLTMCPPVHKHGRGCHLASELLYINQITARNRRLLQDLSISTTDKPTLRQGGEKEKTGLKGTTKLYWNVSHERCDYERIRCLRAYATGAVCARTLYYNYYSFPNYCTLEFHNCISSYEGIWTIAYMGICTELDIEKSRYIDLSYDEMIDNSFLTKMYVVDSGELTAEG